MGVSDYALRKPLAVDRDLSSLPAGVAIGWWGGNPAPRLFCVYGRSGRFSALIDD